MGSERALFSFALLLVVVVPFYVLLVWFCEVQVPYRGVYVEFIRGTRVLVTRRLVRVEKRDFRLPSGTFTGVDEGRVAANSVLGVGRFSVYPRADPTDFFVHLVRCFVRLNQIFR